MKKNILVISSSPRANSNSDALAEQFAAGARAAGHVVEKISLRGKSLNFCRGCLACMKTNRCVIDDDAREIAEKMGRADVLAFATPVYYFGVSGQLKTMLDRANPLYTAHYAFRDVYLLASAADEGAETFEGTEAGIKNWVLCFERARFAGGAYADGVTEPGAVKGHPALQKAYELGRQV